MYGENENNFIIIGLDPSFEWQRKPEKKKKKGGKIWKNIISLVLVAVISASATAGGLWYYDTYVREDFVPGSVVINQYKPDPMHTGTNKNEPTQGTVDDSSGSSEGLAGGAMTAPQIYDQTAASTVLFTCKSPVNSSFPSYGFPSFGGSQQQPQYSVSYGSGIIMSENGYIITNAHVVDGVSEMVVTLYDGREYTATLVGSDTNSDIAVVKIDESNLPAAKFGDSSTLKVGDEAYVVGNPLGADLAFTLTVGYVSSLEREVNIEDTLMTLMQIDAAVNPGNSGGSLADKNGYIVGVINAKIADENVEGIGFAIPINTALKVASDLIQHGYVASRPMLGVTVQSVTKEQAMIYNLEAGITVTEVQEGSCADKGGVKVGDKITHFNGVAVATGGELNFQKEKYSIGDTVTITVIRDGKSMDLSIVLSN